MNWHEYTTNKADMDKIKNFQKNFILICTGAGSNRFENYLLKLGKKIHEGNYGTYLEKKKYAFVVVHVSWLVSLFFSCNTKNLKSGQ